MLDISGSAPAPLWKLNRCDFEKNREVDFRDMLSLIALLPRPDYDITISFLADKTGLKEDTIYNLLNIIYETNKTQLLLADEQIPF